ncbi:MAG TPA: MarR family transcriptional regulator [Anaerolineales bacterium]|nr:MarR family transcriptional regulator [Anaerolineales bacterium]
MELTEATQNFIVHWGEMGTKWGINRTVAQIHALLFISPDPLTAEDISDTLAVARSTVSTSLRELQSWGIVKTVHVFGDRRDHFVTMGDVWEMFRVVLDERKRREMDPALQMLHETLDTLEATGAEDEHTRQKLSEMLDFFETMMSLYSQLQRLPTSSIKRTAKMGNIVTSLIGGS